MSDNENTNEQQTDQADSKQTDQHDDAAGLKSALDKEREARKAADKELKRLSAELEKLTNRDKSDVERLTGELEKRTKEAETAVARARDKAGKASALEAARSANAISATAIYALIRDRIEYDDDDEPTNLERLIADARKAEPSLFQASAGSGDGGRGNNGKTTVDGPATINQLIRQATGVIS